MVCDMADDAVNPSRPPSDREDALAVLRKLREAGHKAYFAGGCVRDLLLGQSPKDYDIATNAPPGRVRELFPSTQAVGAAFGVILVRQRKSQIEVATFRTDGDYSDGRRPDSVKFTTAEEDAQRRDFTINGLFLDPVEDRVIDYVGGQADLAAKVIRAIGDPAARFGEDYLRMLRAVRFAARLGFAIEPATAAAIKSLAGRITQISPERIADELRRMLIAPTRAAAWRMLESTELLPKLFRGIAGAGPSGELMAATEGDRAISFPLVLAVALLSFASVEQLREPWAKDAVRKVRTLLKLSNEERDDLQSILLDASALLYSDQPRARLMRFMAKPTAADTRKLLAVLARAGVANDGVAAVEKSLKPLESLDCNPAPWVNGDHLVAAGLNPGPKFKGVLDAVYDAQLEARVSDAESALQLAMELAKGSN